MMVLLIGCSVASLDLYRLGVIDPLPRLTQPKMSLHIINVFGAGGGEQGKNDPQLRISALVYLS